MLRFKQFISEANISHFAHLGLDPTNPEHKDMVDAYNNGLNHPQNKITAKPNQIKTFDQLKNTVAPHVAAIQQKRQEDAEDKEAFANKEAELVHHDPSTGLKVFKVRSGKGCAAVGGDTKWCVAHRKTGSEAMTEYDPEGEYSHVIHTPEKGNLSKIGIIGVKPGEKHTDGVGGNFQDKGNNTVSDENWETLRKKYNLDNVKALHNIRGLRNPEVAHLVRHGYKFASNPDTSTEDLETIARHSTNSLAHEYIARHKNAGGHGLSVVARKSDDPEVHEAIVNHPNSGEEALSAVANKSKDPKVHESILKHDKVGDSVLSTFARNSEDPKVHESILKHDKVGDYALSAVANKSKDPKVHESILKHDKVGDYALSIVARKSEDPKVHEAILKHDKVGKNALSAVARNSKDPKVHEAILKHDKVEDSVLSSVAYKSDDPKVHESILKHDKVGEYTLENLANTYKTTPDKESISKAIDDHIRSKKGNPYQLESFLKAYRRVIKC